MNGDLADALRAQAKRAAIRFVVVVVLPSIASAAGAVALGVLVLILMLMPVLLIAGVVTLTGQVVTKAVSNAEHGVFHVARCVVTGSCVTSPGPTAPSMDGSAVQLVTGYWLTDETNAVDYYCARTRGRPCVTVAFVQAVMMQESGGIVTASSSAGALGLMQVEPSHFAPGQSPFDPVTNIMVGVSYLDQLDAIFGGNLPLVAAGYNAGPGAVQTWEQEYGTSNWTTLSAQPGVQSYSCSMAVVSADEGICPGGGQTYDYVQYVMAYFNTFSQMAASARAVGVS